MNVRVFNDASISHPASMVPFAWLPSSFSIVTIHTRIPCSLHLVDDCSSDALSTSASTDCIYMLDNRPVDIANFHPDLPFPSFKEPSDPATAVPFRSALRSLPILFSLAILLSPIFLCSRLPLGQVLLVPFYVSIGVTALGLSHLTFHASGSVYLES